MDQATERTTYKVLYHNDNMIPYFQKSQDNSVMKPYQKYTSNTFTKCLMLDTIKVKTAKKKQTRAITTIESAIRDTSEAEVTIEGVFRTVNKAIGKFECLILKERGLLVFGYSREAPKLTADAQVQIEMSEPAPLDLKRTESGDTDPNHKSKEFELIFSPE